MAILNLRHRVPGLLKAVFPGMLWQVPAGEDDKTLYLTFDDGPVPGPTEYVLEVLAQYGIKAAFFAVGENADRYPELARRILEEGHTLANHTYHHVKGWNLSLEAYIQEVVLCREALERVENINHPALRAPLLEKEGSQGSAGNKFLKPLFRPPYGRIKPGQARIVAHRYRIVMWSVLSADYDRDLSVSDCLVNTFRALHPGAIIVFHDSHKAFGRLEPVLPALIEAALHDGWNFKRLS